MTQEELLFFSGHPEALALYTLLKEGLLQRYPDTLSCLQKHRFL